MKKIFLILVIFTLLSACGKKTEQTIEKTENSSGNKVNITTGNLEKETNSQNIKTTESTDGDEQLNINELNQEGSINTGTIEKGSVETEDVRNGDTSSSSPTTSQVENTPQKLKQHTIKTQEKNVEKPQSTVNKDEQDIKSMLQNLTDDKKVNVNDATNYSTETEQSLENTDFSDDKELENLINELVE